MARKTATKERQEALDFYRFHCECVRRNPAYREAYKEWRKRPVGRKPGALEFATWGLMLGDRLPNPNRRPPLEKALARPLPPGVVPPMRPASGQHTRTQQAEHVRRAFTRGSKTVPLNSTHAAGFLALVYFPDQAPQNPWVMAVDTRQSKKDLWVICESLLDTILTDRAKAGLRQESPRMRFRPEECVDYLRAYDMRQAGMMFEAIGRKICRGHLSDAKMTAQTYCRKGKALVLRPPSLPVDALP
jgi:hypothetical protein